MSKTRAELKKAYKATRVPMGVYQLRNTVNGKLLVEVSLDMRAKFGRHQFELKMSSHRNRALQRDWDAHGSDCFVFEVLEELEPLDDAGYDPAADLELLEQMWIDKLRPYGDKGYNPAP